MSLRLAVDVLWRLLSTSVKLLHRYRIEPLSRLQDDSSFARQQQGGVPVEAAEFQQGRA